MLRKKLGIHSEKYKAKDRVVENLNSNGKADVWERKVPTAKTKKEMWSILRSITTNGRVPTARIIGDRVNIFVSLKQNATGFGRHYRDVRNLKFGKHE